MNRANKKYNAIAIIPARYSSSRFPGKPLALIAGKTLLQRTYEQAIQCKVLSRILIATDDQRIFDHATSFGAEVVMTPTDCPTGSDRLAYVLKQYPELQQADIIVNVQGDEPCIDPNAIEKLVAILSSDQEAVMSTACFPLTCPHEVSNPNTVKCIFDRNHNALYFSRGLLPSGRSEKYCPNTPYYKHVGLYAYRPDFLLKYGTLPMTPLQIAEDLEQLKVLEHGYKIKVTIINKVGPDVNTPEDLIKVEQAL